MILKKSRRDVPLCINDGNVGHMDKRLLLNLPPHDVAHQCNAMQLHTERYVGKVFNGKIGFLRGTIGYHKCLIHEWY